MSTLPTVQNSQTPAFSPEEIGILKNQIMKGASDAELALFGKVCAQTGLSPFARQIFAVPREVYNRDTKMKEKQFSFQTSVDGFRLVANRSGQYEGQTLTQWCGKDGVWKDIWLSDDPPAAARVGVWRKNFREPLYGVAVWESYAQMYQDSKTEKWIPTSMWAKMPDLMLAKCAECLALRKAFPQELSGLYSKEEMSQAEEAEEEKPLSPQGSISSNTRAEVEKPTARVIPSSGPIKVAEKLPVAAPRLNPETHITTGASKGKKIEDMSDEFLEDWTKHALAYLQKAGHDPETSFLEMARTYRAIKKMSTGPSMFESSPGGGINGAQVEHDLP